MATHAYIFEFEDRIIKAEDAVTQVTHAYQKEVEAGIPGPGDRPGIETGHPYRANSAPWNTLLLNAQVLKRRIESLLALAEKYPPLP